MLKQSKLDPAVFVLQTHELNGIICCHVDNFLYAGNESLEKIMTHLQQRFLAGRVEEKSFNYLGFQINQENDKIILDHTDYVLSLRNLTMDPERARQKQDILSIEEQTLFRKLVGQLNRVVQTSRPELSFEMVDFSTKLKENNVSDLLHAIKVVNMLNDMKYIVCFPKLEKPQTDWKM